MKLSSSVITLKDPEYIRYMVAQAFEEKNIDIDSIEVVLSGVNTNTDVRPNSNVYINTYRIDVNISGESEVMVALDTPGYDRVLCDALATHIQVFSRDKDDLTLNSSKLPLNEYIDTLRKRNGVKIND